MEIIGDGSYGCAIKPAITKEIKKTFMKYKNKKKDDIGKVFKKGYSDFKYEFDNGKLLNKIDPKHLFSIELKAGYKIKNKKIEDCVDKTEYYQIIYENGGVTLSDMKKMTMNDFFEKFLIMMEGLEKIHNLGLLHRDIKPDNILIKDEKISLIDFGLVESFNDVYDIENDHVLKYKYPFYPPEFIVMYHVLNGNEDLIKKCEEDYKNRNTSNSLFQCIDSYKKYFTHEKISKKQSFNELIELLKKKDFKNIIIKNVDKADIYGIGITLLIIIEDIEFENKKEKKIYKKLVKNCINFNVENRWSCKEIINYIKINMDNNVKGGAKTIKPKKDTIKPKKETLEGPKLDKKERHKKLRKLIQKLKL